MKESGYINTLEKNTLCSIYDNSMVWMLLCEFVCVCVKIHILKETKWAENKVFL